MIMMQSKDSIQPTAPSNYKSSPFISVAVVRTGFNWLVSSRC